MAGTGVLIQVLGPVEICHPGGRIHLAKRQQRMVLGILSLSADRVVPMDQLVDYLWGDRSPPAARAVIQTRVSEIRAKMRALGPAAESPRLTTTGGGYLLRARPEQVDAVWFQHLVRDHRQGDDARTACESLERALALWHGPPLGGEVTAPLYADLCRPLELARLTALEDLIALLLDAGDVQQAADRAEASCAEHPTRERLVGLAMRALQRAGRSAEALRRYDNTRHHLRDQLGVDPGDALKRLHLAILRGEDRPPPPAVVATGGTAAGDAAAGGAGTGTTQPADPSGTGAFRASVPRTLPPAVSDFAGRAADIDRLRSLLARDTDPGGARVVAISGQGGVGKTALSVRAAHELAADFPDGQLFATMRGGQATDDNAAASEILGRFLRALGVDGAAMPRSLDARVDLYRDLLAERRVMVVLDNAASDDQVRPLVPGGTGCAVIVNSRHRLGATLGATTLHLDVLTPDEAIALLARVAGERRVAAESDAAADLCAHCGHLPLAIRVAGAKLIMKPHWSVAHVVELLADERGRLDQFVYGELNVRASIGLSYSALDATARRLLRGLADLDLPDVPVWVAAALLDTDVHAAENALEQLFDAQLLTVSGGGTGRARFSMHDLVRLFARERMAVEDREADLASGRSRVFGACLHLAGAAYRQIYGGPSHDIRGDSPRWELDAAETDLLTSHPLRWFDQDGAVVVALVSRACSGGYHPACWELASTTSPLFDMRRDFDEWQRMLELALTAARDAGDLRGEAAMLFRTAWVLVDHVEYEAAGRRFEDAAGTFERIGDRHGHALAVTFRGLAERLAGNDAAAAACYRFAQPVLHEFADLGGEAFVLRNIGQMKLRSGDLDAAGTLFERALRLYDAAGAAQGYAQANFWRSMLLLQQERIADAERGFTLAMESARRLGDRPGEALSLHGLGMCHAKRGDRDEAKATMLAALRIVQQPRPTAAEMRIRASLASLE